MGGIRFGYNFKVSSRLYHTFARFFLTHTVFNCIHRPFCGCYKRDATALPQ